LILLLYLLFVLLLGCLFNNSITTSLREVVIGLNDVVKLEIGIGFESELLVLLVPRSDLAGNAVDEVTAFEFESLGLGE
jgi:hypothetical protein